MSPCAICDMLRFSPGGDFVEVYRHRSVTCRPSSGFHNGPADSSDRRIVQSAIRGHTTGTKIQNGRWCLLIFSTTESYMRIRSARRPQVLRPSCFCSFNATPPQPEHRRTHVPPSHPPTVALCRCRKTTSRTPNTPKRSLYVTAEMQCR